MGHGGSESRILPTQTATLGTGRTATEISAGSFHTCAILDDGNVACWGYNANGQLGDGTTSSRDTPAPTATLGAGRTAITIDTGSEHTCAILDDGTVACWGDNLYGQLGDGGNNDRLSPTQISSVLDSYVAINAGGDHTCTITDDGNVFCWGVNSNGQLGDGTATNQNRPIQSSSLGLGRTASLQYRSFIWTGTPYAPDAAGTLVQAWANGSTEAWMAAYVVTVVPAFEYPSTTISILTNNPMTSQTPSVNCTWCTFAIHPDLPSGLTFGTSSGTLSGEPENALPMSEFTIYANASNGSYSSSIHLLSHGRYRWRWDWKRRGC